MAALSAPRSTHKMGSQPLPSLLNYDAAATAVGYQGGIAVLNASGFLAPGTAAANLVAVGIFSEDMDNSAGANSAIKGAVECGVFKFANHGSNTLAITDIGSVCYIEDDQTVGSDATSKSVAGKVVAVDSDGVWVRINPAV